MADVKAYQTDLQLDQNIMNYFFTSFSSTTSHRWNTMLVLHGVWFFKAMGVPGAKGGYGVTFLSFISAGRRTDCEAAKCLEGALPVQYFILIEPSGVRGVSSEEQWEKPEGTFIPGEKHRVCGREVQKEQGKKGREHRQRGSGLQGKKREKHWKDETNKKCLRQEEGWRVN